VTDRTGAHLKTFLKSAAIELGLDCIAVTKPSAIPEAAARLQSFLADGRHGDMQWLADKADKRADPIALWPDVRSVIMIGQSYAPTDNPLTALEDPRRAAISVYAKGRDYHDVLKKKIRTLAEKFAGISGADVKIFVDTAPLLEKPLAAAAGLGWQGKHTNLVSREHGSWLFLGAILTTAEIEPDTPETDHCGSCRKCLDVCPTAAFPAPYQLDARRCLAYLTIEHKGHIAQEFRKPLGNRVFGCDDCLAVCPWNKFAEASREAKFAATPETDNPPLPEILALSDAEFRIRFAGTPVKRTGRDRVVRNALIAAGNSGDASLIPLVQRLLDDASPLVRAMAIWAMHELEDNETFQALRQQRLSLETDPDVANEWHTQDKRPSA
jgi:epoxyqueuosine reductase